jgi:hypothetical protein
MEGMQRPEEHFNPYLQLLSQQDQLRQQEELQAAERRKAAERQRIMAQNPPPLWIAPTIDAMELAEVTRADPPPPGAVEIETLLRGVSFARTHCSQRL